MSIEYRAGRRYYYRVERVNGKLKKTYIGGGITGEFAAREMQQKAALRQREIAERNEFNNQLWSLKRIHRLADSIAREAYYAAHLLAGYEQARNYKWRKIKSLSFRKAASHMDDSTKERVQQEQSKPIEEMSIKEVLESVVAGRQELRPRLRKMLSEMPEKWKKYADTADMAIDRWASHLSHGNALLRESILIKGREHRKELMSRATNCMERVLVDRVVLTALQLEFFELQASVLGLDEDQSRVGKAIHEGLKSANFQFDHAIKQLNRVEELRSELLPRKDAMAAAQLRVYDPDNIQKCG